VWCAVYFDMLNRLGVDYECDRGTDGHTDRNFNGKGSALIRRAAKNDSDSSTFNAQNDSA